MIGSLSRQLAKTDFDAFGRKGINGRRPCSLRAGIISENVTPGSSITTLFCLSIRMILFIRLRSTTTASLLFGSDEPRSRGLPELTGMRAIEFAFAHFTMSITSAVESGQTTNWGDIRPEYCSRMSCLSETLSVPTRLVRALIIVFNRVLVLLLSTLFVHYSSASSRVSELYRITLTDLRTSSTFHALRCVVINDVHHIFA